PAFLQLRSNGRWWTKCAANLRTLTRCVLRPIRKIRFHGRLHLWVVRIPQSHKASEKLHVDDPDTNMATILQPGSVQPRSLHVRLHTRQRLHSLCTERTSR